MAERDGPSNRTVARITLVVLGVCSLVSVLFLIRQIIILVVVAAFLAVGLDPFVRVIQRRGVKRGIAVSLVLVGALLLVGGFVAAVTPPLVRQTVRLAQQLPEFAEDLRKGNSRFGELDERFDISGKLRNVVEDAPDLIAGSSGRALGFARSVGSSVVTILTITVLTIYFLLDLPKLKAGALKLFAKSRRPRMQEHFDVISDSIGNYIVGNLATSAIAGIVSFIVLSVIGVPYALPLAIWVAIADLIPLVGAMVGAIPGTIVAFFHSPGTGIATAIFFLAYQQIENYVVQPRVMRQAVNVSAAAVLLAALVGATLLGFVGALIAIPIAASIKVIGQRTWLETQEGA